MSMYCPSCNNRYKDDSVFCPDCGSSLIDEQQYLAEVYKEEETPKENLYPAVSTATYFWLNLVMPLPFVGFILSIILTCAPKNRSLKNYARAYLIVNIIIVGLCTTGFILSLLLGGGLFALFEDVPAASNPYMGF